LLNLSGNLHSPFFRFSRSHRSQRLGHIETDTNFFSNIQSEFHIICQLGIAVCHRILGMSKPVFDEVFGSALFPEPCRTKGVAWRESPLSQLSIPSEWDEVSGREHFFVTSACQLCFGTPAQTNLAATDRRSHTTTNSGAMRRRAEWKGLPQRRGAPFRAQSDYWDRGRGCAPTFPICWIAWVECAENKSLAWFSNQGAFSASNDGTMS